MPSRRHVATLVALSVLVIFFFTFFRTQQLGTRDIDYRTTAAIPLQDPLSSHAIAPKLGNETAKAELGRATWKYLHTVMARFPDKPTEDESTALRTFIHLFQRLYPCGECAEHFGAIIKKFPPQVSSRSAAAVWACHVHNEVNKSLKKDIFDCANIGDFYDCGCAEDEGKGKKDGEKTKRSA
ncbi:related to ERV1 protein, mitochondrial precursor [Ramularia collo-cygni]|uniref:Sulfhydryl oxidase n=1 Tax=Ramularia collo-cygni TaxID=112498 RepID=A0A2D3UQF3_9PEZI|nr:related to ERV1 protein, mitochondrial precursor [Ramularia collo-cygni]CZT17951.1 related to ERV1 protein, mitochondrial precursor [Ramularia collo-cygni]